MCKQKATEQLSSCNGYAGVAWDHRSHQLLSVTAGKHMRVWALPESHQPLPGPSSAAQPSILQLQLVFSTTLALDAPSRTSLLRNSASGRLAAMLHCHRQSTGFQVWLQTGGLAILSALHHPLVKSDQSLAFARRVAYAPQAAAEPMSMRQDHWYKGHQVQPS